jgi:hypothetical protein
MKYEYYNPVDEKGGCVTRSISKLLNKDYNQVKNELIDLSKSLGYSDYREIEVFVTYLKKYNVLEIPKEYNCKVEDLIIEPGKYIIFGNKDDWYHMVCLIDNTFYDKNERYQDLNIIKIYKLK